MPFIRKSLSRVASAVGRVLPRPRKRTVVAVSAVLLLVGAFAVQRLFSVSCSADVPCVTLAALKDGAPLPEAMHVLDRYGDPLADVSGPRRRAIADDHMPERLKRSWVAVEDKRFWDHGGVDFRGVARAVIQDLRSRSLQEGASTIPMQLVRTLWAENFRGVNPLRRKLIEARTARELVGALGHERVLTLYLNSIYMGNGLYGVGAASRYYFGVSPEDLTLAETATLVGMTRTPEKYEPRRHPERAKRRRDVVLGVLARAGIAGADEAEAARATPVRTTDVPPDLYRRSYITAAVRRALNEVAPDLADRSGIYVYTTIDPRIQQAGTEALRTQLATIERGYYGRIPGGDKDDPLQGAAVSVDTHTGAVRAWVGGRDFGGSQFDRVAQGRRQVGSLVKPFIVASALEEGYGILDAVSADTFSIRSGQSMWSPADHVQSPMLPMREALVHSSNRAAVHLGSAVGFDRFRAVAREAGLQAEIPELPSVFIGSFEASLLHVTGAFASFDNGGFQVEPYLVERVEDADHKILWEHQAPDSLAQPLDQVTAFVVLDAMRDVVDRGTGRPVRATGYEGPAAGKTGTTNGSRDAWFVGLVPGLASGVWIGFDTPRTVVRGGSGGSLAGPVWGNWMKDATDSGAVPHLEWIAPLGVRRVRYDESTGTPVPETCHGGESSSYAAAYVPEGMYDVRRCPGGFGDWLRDLWHMFKSDDVKPVVPITKRDPNADTIRGGLPN